MHWILGSCELLRVFGGKNNDDFLHKLAAFYTSLETLRLSYFKFQDIEQ